MAAAAEAEPEVVWRAAPLPVRLPQADGPSIKALMHQDSNATRCPARPAASQLPQPVAGDAEQASITSQMGFHNDDDVGVPC